MSIGPNSRHVAIIDDDDSVRCALQDLIETEGLSTLCFASAEQFLDFEARHQAACVICDIRMPGMSGLDLQAKLKAERFPVPIIFITAHGNAEMRTRALRDGAVEFLTKPFDDAVLLETVHAALERSARIDGLLNRIVVTSFQRRIPKPAYLVFTRTKTIDQKELKKYWAGIKATMEGHPIEVLVAYGDYEVLEGDPIEGIVIAKFPDVKAAKNWYYSDAYQSVAKHRKHGAVYQGLIVEGVS
jgi:CheY-like chemotaxis protein/uncharacterized protein (DUF1330 family)